MSHTRRKRPRDVKFDSAEVVRATSVGITSPIAAERQEFTQSQPSSLSSDDGSQNTPVPKLESPHAAQPSQLSQTVFSFFQPSSIYPDDALPEASHQQHRFINIIDELLARLEHNTADEKRQFAVAFIYALGRIYEEEPALLDIIKMGLNNPKSLAGKTVLLDKLQLEAYAIAALFGNTTAREKLQTFRKENLNYYYSLKPEMNIDDTHLAVISKLKTTVTYYRKKKHQMLQYMHLPEDVNDKLISKDEIRELNFYLDTSLRNCVINELNESDNNIFAYLKAYLEKHIRLIQQYFAGKIWYEVALAEVAPTTDITDAWLQNLPREPDMAIVIKKGSILHIYGHKNNTWNLHNVVMDEKFLAKCHFLPIGESEIATVPLAIYEAVALSHEQRREDRAESLIDRLIFEIGKDFEINSHYPNKIKMAKLLMENTSVPEAKNCLEYYETQLQAQADTKKRRP